MECGRAGTASAAAEPVRAPARRAGSSAKWAAFHSSVQPESCRFNRTPALGVIAEYGETVESPHYASIGHTLHDNRCVGAPETERIRQRHPDLALAGLLGNEIDGRVYRRIVQIDSGRPDVVANGKDAEDRLHRTRSAEQMAGG